MRNTRGWKHYAIFFGIAVLFYFVYISILAIQNGGYDTNSLLGMIYMPVFFIVLLFILDTLFDTFLGKKKSVQRSDFETFAKTCTMRIKAENDFSLEDFRRLRESDRFQKALRQAHKIKVDGESEELDIALLERKFKPGTREYLALQAVINLLRNSTTNS